MMPMRMPQSAQSQILSVILPCFNEEEVIIETHRRMVEAAAAFGIDTELVYVDDGSRDGTLAMLRGLQPSRAVSVRVVALSRNFGHQAAVTAGLEHARGDAVAIIDADLQDPPEVIGEMLARWRQGYQVVYGRRVERAGETAFKRWTAAWFYRIINRLSDVPIPLDTGDFRLLDRQAVEALNRMPERDRFLRGMAAWIGFRQCAVNYDRAARAAGTTKYPLRKMIAFACNGILSFSVTPLRLATLIGFLASLASGLLIAYAVVMRLTTNTWVSGWTLLIITVCFLGGVQLICMGIIGEYVGRTYQETKRRPLYLVAAVDDLPALV